MLIIFYSENDKFVVWHGNSKVKLWLLVIVRQVNGILAMVPNLLWLVLHVLSWCNLYSDILFFNSWIFWSCRKGKLDYDQSLHRSVWKWILVGSSLVHVTFAGCIYSVCGWFVLLSNLQLQLAVGFPFSPKVFAMLMIQANKRALSLNPGEAKRVYGESLA